MAEASTEVPEKGQWPVNPQEDVPISKDRIWVDGCFDFSHHGIVAVFIAPEVLLIDSSRSRGSNAASPPPGQGALCWHTFG